MIDESERAAGWIADGIKEADRNRTPDMALRHATVHSVDLPSQTAFVVVDGDDEESQVQIRSSGIALGARVLVAFTSDGGAFIVGSAASSTPELWLPYVPVLRFGVTEWTQGDGAIRGLWRFDGMEVEFIATVEWGTTSAVPAGGAMSLTLPSIAAPSPGLGITIGTNVGYHSLTGMILDEGTTRGWFPGWISPDFPDRAFLIRTGIGVMSLNTVDETILTPGSPGFAVNDQISIRGRYTPA